MQEIVIKIDENLYTRLFDNGGVDALDMLIACAAIRKGTVLPKGHGALKDFDKIEWYGCDFEGRGCIEAKGDCGKCDFAECYAKQVRELPTIIEADRSEE